MGDAGGIKAKLAQMQQEAELLEKRVTEVESANEQTRKNAARLVDNENRNMNNTITSLEKAMDDNFMADNANSERLDGRIDDSEKSLKKERAARNKHMQDVEARLNAELEKLRTDMDAAFAAQTTENERLQKYCDKQQAQLNNIRDRLLAAEQAINGVIQPGDDAAKRVTGKNCLRVRVEKLEAELGVSVKAIGGK